MTPARQRRKPRFGLAFLAAAGIFLAIAAAPVRATAEPVAVNPNTGLAISGFDPVAYFADRKPRIGRADLELRVDGVVWRFANAGDRAAFKDHPEVYAPRFGGYDPVALARGASVAGHPMYWAVSGERLYLFYDAAARAAFLADPGRYIEAATRKWPALQRTIAQ